MIPYEFPNFQAAISQAQTRLQFKSKLVHSEHWQGTAIANKPEMAMHELTHLSFAVSLVPVMPAADDSLDIVQEWREDIKPDLPWADDHFAERVGGKPMNPDPSEAWWPHGQGANGKFKEGEIFSHTYSERFWPKEAGKQEDEFIPSVMQGIRYAYGDVADVADMLAADPYSRQAYLPIWFPEDTGGDLKLRKPCSIGYHFLMRDGKLDINYHIRSCDFTRHFRNDLYLTARLALWMRNRVAELNPLWEKVQLGRFIMQIGSLHMFRNDYHRFFGPKR